MDRANLGIGCRGEEGVASASIRSISRVRATKAGDMVEAAHDK
jgi:hypothetical protein